MSGPALPDPLVPGTVYEVHGHGNHEADLPEIKRLIRARFDREVAEYSAAGGWRLSGEVVEECVRDRLRGGWIVSVSALVEAAQ